MNTLHLLVSAFLHFTLSRQRKYNKQVRKRGRTYFIDLIFENLKRYVLPCLAALLVFDPASDESTILHHQHLPRLHRAQLPWLNRSGSLNRIVPQPQ